MNWIKNISFHKLSVFIDQGIVSGVNFLLGILLANLLGLDQYGVFAFLWMIIFFVSSIQQAFIISPLYTLFPKHPVQKQYVQQLFGLQLIFSGIVFVSVYGLTNVIVNCFPEYQFQNADFMVALVSSIYTLHDFLRRLFFSMKLPNLSLTIDIIGYGLQPIVLYAIYQLNMLNLTTVFLSLSGTLLIGALIGIVLGKVRTSFLCRQTIVSHWHFSKYLVGTSLLQWLSGNFFVAVSAGILGPTIAGVIRMSQNIVGVLHILFLAFENTIPLQLSEILQKKGKVQMFQFIRLKVRQAIIPVVILLAAIVLLSKTIIAQLYGPEYVEYQYVLYAFCLLYVFVFVGTFLRFIIRTLEQNKIIFISYIATSVFSLLLAKLMVENLNILGVLLGLIVSQIITNAIYLMALKSDIKWMLK